MAKWMTATCVFCKSPNPITIDFFDLEDVSFKCRYCSKSQVTKVEKKVEVEAEVEIVKPKKKKKVVEEVIEKVVEEEQPQVDDTLMSYFTPEE